MLRKFILASALFAYLAAPCVALAADAPQAAQAALSTGTTDIGTLLDNPAAKAVLDKHLPGFADNPQISMARSMTLKQIQAFAGDAITDQKLALIDADLAKLPAGK